jgi:hypothetical protein
MATFTYKYKQEMDPVGRNPYKTIYIKQSHAEHHRLQNWLIQVAEQILGACEANASAAEWFCSPMREFKKSQKGQYYSPEDLLTDMIGQLGKDLPQAMLDRWNRLMSGTHWEIELVDAKKPKTSHIPQVEALFERNGEAL